MPDHKTRPIHEQKATLTPLADRQPVRVPVKTIQWVALFPARYALGDNRSKTPKVAAPFRVQDSNGKAMAAQGDTHYTLRRPRMGYLYAFNEKDHLWALYQVDSKGQLTPLQMNDLKSPELSYTTMGLVLVPKDTPVWLGLSDAKWTPRTLSKAKTDAAFRKKIMRRFDPAARAGPHAATLLEAGKHVADLTPGMSPQAFWFSQDPFAKMPMAALTQGIDPTSISSGAVVALEDPAGIAMDLASMMTGRLEAWSSKPDPLCKGRTTKWALFSSTAIDGLREMVATQAEYQEYAAAIRLRDQTMANSMGMAYFNTKLRDFFSEAGIQKNLAARKDKTRMESWDKYAAKYNEASRIQWKADYKQRLQDFDTKSILPLAHAHVAWVDCQRFKGYFNAVFDSVDVVSGLAYTHTLDRCYTGVQDKGPCAAYMTKWLKAELTSENLLLRGLVLNLKKTAADIRAAVSLSMDLRGLPWDGLISGFSATVEAIKRDKDAVIVRYIATLGHPIAEVLKEALNGPIRHAAAALGVVSETPMVCVEIVGSKKTFRAMLVKELLGLNKGKPSANQVQMATAAEMKRLEVHGVPMEGTHQQRFLLMVDPEEAKAMPKGLKPKAQAEWLAQSIRTPEEVEALNLAKWQSKLKNGWGKGAPMIFGAVAGICQFLSMSKLSADLEKGTSFEKTENQWRHGASVGALAGTVGELLGEVIEKRASTFSAQAASQGIKFAGKALGFVAGLVMAGVDWYKYSEAKGHQEYGLAAAYFISAGLGAGATICFFLATFFAWMGPIGWALVILSIGITVLIEYIKDSKFQEWLNRSCWGTLREKEGYRSMDSEMGDFNIAMAG